MEAGPRRRVGSDRPSRGALDMENIPSQLVMIRFREPARVSSALMSPGTLHGKSAQLIIR